MFTFESQLNNILCQKSSKLNIEMKKIVSLITFLMLFGSIVYGQANFRFGFQLSPNITWLTSDDNMINGNGSNLGLKLGMMGEKYLTNSENYAFTFGIGFAFNQGGTLKHDEGGNFWTKSDLSSTVFNSLPDGINLKYGIQYVEIPLGFKMRTQEFGYLRYFAEPGMTIGIGTQARGSVSGVTGFETENENIKKDINGLNLSWGIGGGVEYGLGESTALIGGLYFQSGFTDVTDDSAQKIPLTGEPEAEDSKGTIKSITLRIGIMF